MALLNRVFQKIFGKSADSNDMGVVGSKANNSPQTSKDIATIQSLSNWESGMRNIVSTSNAPYLQDHNSLFYVITYQLAYLFQAGIAEWNSSTEYFSGRSVVLRSGKVYIATANSTGVEPEVTSGWESSWKSLDTDWGRINGSISNQTDLIKYVGVGYYAECNSSASAILKEITLNNLVLEGNGDIPEGTKITVCFKNGSDCLLYDANNDGASAKLKITTGSGTIKELYINIGGNALESPSGNRYKKLFCPNSYTNIITFTVYNKIFAMTDRIVVKEKLSGSGTRYDFRREYLDGFCEQEGQVNFSSGSASSDQTVNFFVTFATTHPLHIGLTPVPNNGYYSDHYYVKSMGSSSMVLTSGTYGSHETSLMWKVEGYRV